MTIALILANLEAYFPWGWVPDKGNVRATHDGVNYRVIKRMEDFYIVDAVDTSLDAIHTMDMMCKGTPADAVARVVEHRMWQVPAAKAARAYTGPCGLF